MTNTAAYQAVSSPALMLMVKTILFGVWTFGHKEKSARFVSTKARLLGVSHFNLQCRIHNSREFRFNIFGDYCSCLWIWSLSPYSKIPASSPGGSQLAAAFLPARASSPAGATGARRPSTPTPTHRSPNIMMWQWWHWHGNGQAMAVRHDN